MFRPTHLDNLLPGRQTTADDLFAEKRGEIIFYEKELLLRIRWHPPSDEALIYLRMIVTCFEANPTRIASLERKACVS
jgi:hypothetical protein